MFDEDMVDHIAKVLELLDLIKIPGVDSHQLRMKVFPLSLADDARQWRNGGELKEVEKEIETMKGYESDERITFEFILRGFAESEIWDKVKVPLSPRMNGDEYSICCENTTHMMNALKEAIMESREMLLSIHHSLKMLLEIISKMNRKLEDEKIKRNDKGKEKVNDF
ncbi:hypothetical protein Tco_0128709 [Tanacetum coccineum]